MAMKSKAEQELLEWYWKPIRDPRNKTKWVQGYFILTAKYGYVLKYWKH